METYISRAITSLIQKLKNDRTYIVVGNYSIFDFFTIVACRGLGLVRGVLPSIMMRGRGLLFMGKRVSVDNIHRISREGVLLIEDDVSIQAISGEGIQFGSNVSIGKKSILQCTGIIRNQGVGIRIGNNTGIGPMSFIGGQGGVEIGNDVIAGPGLRIFSENHKYNKDEIPIRHQGEVRAKVQIGDNCWIGSNVIITAGVIIGSGCVIGAGAVVTKNFEKDSVIVGNPARRLKSRFE